MSAELGRQLAEAVANTPLADRVGAAAAPLLERRGDDAASSQMGDGARLGLARMLATRPETAGFLSHRPELFERLTTACQGSLASRAQELASSDPGAPGDDLEAELDALRILRREETCFAACHDLGGLVAFEEISDFLSVLAENIAQRALELARQAAPAGPPDSALAVIGMGKIAGREFTYHSDLDLIFLYGGGAEELDRSSRVGQRFISYLTTMTGAGVAYAVDTRLRPSGGQGTLVTSFEGFDRYQGETAQTWEHLALLRARAIAGDIQRGQKVLDHVRASVLARRVDPWEHLAELRERVEQERAAETDAVPFKTGAGGLMDVDFMAGGGLLEKGTESFPALPSVAAMLRATARGERAEALLADYRFLRVLEARARWLAGRAIEALADSEEIVTVVAELMETGLPPGELRERLNATRRRIRACYDAVIEAGTIDALD